jgi:hypothetical protein
MISDTLFRACSEIEYYLEKFPDVYLDLEEEIRTILVAMRKLQKKLDTPPTLSRKEENA